MTPRHHPRRARAGPDRRRRRREAAGRLGAGRPGRVDPRRRRRAGRRGGRAGADRDAGVVAAGAAAARRGRPAAAASCGCSRDALEEGSLLEVIIDTADPQAKPVPRPDLRRILVPLGPVLVFAASNFPFAFSVCGGDTASALAAGCPVIVKAHPGHPELSVRTAEVMIEALRTLRARRPARSA